MMMVGKRSRLFLSLSIIVLACWNLLILYKHDKENNAIIPYYDGGGVVMMTMVTGATKRTLTTPKHNVRRLSPSSSSSSTTTTTTTSVTSDWKSSQIVILAGPHKTGTTSVQSCMVAWARPLDFVSSTNTSSSSQKTTTTTPIFGDWVWPVQRPRIEEKAELRRLNVRAHGSDKFFATLVSVLLHDAREKVREQKKKKQQQQQQQQRRQQQQQQLEQNISTGVTALSDTDKDEETEEEDEEEEWLQKVRAHQDRLEVKKMRRFQMSDGSRVDPDSVFDYFRKRFAWIWYNQTSIGTMDNNNGLSMTQHNRGNDTTTTTTTNTKLLKHSKIVFGAEALDLIVKPDPVVYGPIVASSVGTGSSATTIHRDEVFPYADPIVNRILSLLPWEENDSTTKSDELTFQQQATPSKPSTWSSSSPTDSSIGATTDISTNFRPPLHLDDIEVVVNYRIPRIEHLISIWHQVGGRNETLQQFLSYDGLFYLYQSNSLQMALQFAQRGVRTTILDLSGIPQREDVCHVVACDILRVQCDTSVRRKVSFPSSSSSGRMDRTTTTPTTSGIGLSEEQKVNVSGWEVEGEEGEDVTKSNIGLIRNQKKNQTDIGLSEDQLMLIDKVMNEYDCSLQSSLLSYQQSKRIRILHQNKLFRDCSVTSSFTSSLGQNTTTTPTAKPFAWMVQEIQKIVIIPNDDNNNNDDDDDNGQEDDGDKNAHHKELA